MAGPADADGVVVLETERLLLRHWRVTDAAVQRDLWLERDPRVPAHRRIDADGRPTLAEFEEGIRRQQPAPIELLAIERKDAEDLIGYCGLVDGERGDLGEPELAFELLQRTWGQGYATEAALAVIDRARRSGYRRLWATVREWNQPSRRVLAKLGFTETGQVDASAAHGDSLHTTLELTREPSQ